MSPKTIERAKENLTAHKNIQYICDDFISHNFKETFDIIYSSLVMMHFKEQSHAVILWCT
ncbi:MAG: class I SAM-dependent methyltransferase [Lachnospiraceae bacterium]